MSCFCTGWRRYQKNDWFVVAKRCGPSVGRGARQIEANISRTDIDGWYRPTVHTRNRSGFIVGTTSGRPEKGLQTAKRVGDEMLADACRMHGLSGLSRNLFGRRR